MALKSMTLITFLLSSRTCMEPGYYWRDYYGVVPEDAVVAGKTIDDINTYIGQAYVPNAGLIVAQIFPGVKEVYAAYGGVKKIDNYIKILCGPQESFYWLKTNYTNLHQDLLDQTAVIGGHEDKNGYMNIGRIYYSGETKIGKVNSFWLEKAYFHFNDNGTERKLGSYEVLMYKKGSLGVDVRISAN